jgi:hypothetical protein
MTDLTLSISGSRTVPATDLADLSGALEALTAAHERDDPVAVRAGSLRWRDGGVWVSVTLALPTEPDSIEADSRTLAQVASETGLVDDEAAALEAINVR